MKNMFTISNILGQDASFCDYYQKKIDAIQGVIIEDVLID